MQPADDVSPHPADLRPVDGNDEDDRHHVADGDDGRQPARRDPRRDDMQNAFDFGNARRVAASRSASRAGDRRQREAEVGELDDRAETPGGQAAVRPSAGLRVADYMEGSDTGWDGRPAHVSPVIEYTDAVDEEEIWGPRPKLLAAENGGRRTVVITGHGADRLAPPRTGARDDAPIHARHGFSADRTAMWAVLLCVIVLLVAITSH